MPRSSDDVDEDLNVVAVVMSPDASTEAIIFDVVNNQFPVGEKGASTNGAAMIRVANHVI